MRVGEIKRKTKETNIDLSLNLDGSGKIDIDTGIGFFDHMLDLMCRHGFLDM
jgi:imidazoleglycerol-phosphate dehydratase